MFIVTFLFFLSLFMLVLNMRATNIENRTVKTFENQHVYQISDNLFEQREVDFYREKDSFKRLNDFNNALINSKKFIVYTARNQPMEVIDFKGDALFSPNYETELEQPTPVSRNDQVYYTIQTLLVNHQVLLMNHLQLTEGELFTKEAYLYEENKVFPIFVRSRLSRCLSSW